MSVVSDTSTPLTRIAVFYDGTFFMNSSQYFNYNHPRGEFIDFDGLHEYIRREVANFEASKNIALCQIVESHFFRGRFSLNAAKEHESLEKDRLQDQLLMNAGIVSHYYPMNENTNPPSEKGIDVWLSLEAYDLAVHKRFDVMVLFAGDQDFVPLVRKVNGLGTRVMIVGMDVEWEQDGKDMFIKTSPRLIDEASYSTFISEDVDSKTSHKDRVIDGIFNE